MPMRYRSRRIVRKIPLEKWALAPDENERFVQHHFCRYLINLAESANPMDSEFLETALDILGGEATSLPRKFEELLRPGLKKRFLADMEEAAGDMEETAAAIYYGFVHSTHRIQKEFNALVIQVLLKRWKRLSAGPVSQFKKNIEWLAKMMRLEDLEKELLVFLVILSFSERAEAYFVDHLKCQSFTKRGLLGSVLGIPKIQVESLLNGRVSQVGIIDSDAGVLSLSAVFRKLIENPNADAMADMLYGSLKGEALPISTHLVNRKDLDYVLRLLKSPVRSATHILLYGEPGTGKTCFANSLAKDTNAVAYEILHSTDNEGDKRRLAITACMNMLDANPDALIIVDEADNLLNTAGAWMHRGETQDKGWLNRLLESPGPRFIWIVNGIGGIDPSVLRRFAYSIPFHPFGKQERLRAMDSVLRKNRVSRMLSKEQVSELAGRYPVSAGPMDIAVKKAQQIKAARGEGFFEAVETSLCAYERLINGGHPPVKTGIMDKSYDLSGLNIKGDVQQLLRRLEKWAADCQAGIDCQGARLLFYGPPGTGKSETARFLAAHLNRELLVKNASDIQDKFIGETEKNIRDAFAQAYRENAVLVFDEADTFLFPRASAERSWEISCTNEFLARMERFTGLLICTTNRFTDMDEAAVRRFTHKLGFDYLKPQASADFYERLLSPLAGCKPSAAILDQVRRLQLLTPGDFAVVRDQFRFFPVAEVTHAAMLSALQQEVDAKKRHNGSRAIGF
ncbi:MAG: AAA family ATPase [Thermodesulfobacteriota bacterium]